jgi:hypothetical protein
VVATLEVAGNCATAGQPNDPIAIAYWRTLEVAGNCATTVQPSDPIAMATLEVARNCATTEQPNDPIAIAFQRTLEDQADAATTEQPSDPIVIAFRRTLEGFVDPATNGQPDDLLVGENIGGVNVSGAAVELYATSRTLVEAPGVSGDTSCTDHVIPLRLRKALGFGQVPDGVHPEPDGSTDDTNIYLVGGETSNGFNAPHALHQPPIRILMLLSKGGL